jgi:serine/threonine-protein kinase
MAKLLERLQAALADRYVIERELGRGGMAVVYLAEDRRHHRQVAIKVLKPVLTASFGPDRFLREIEVTAGLNHPHILPLLDSGDADGLLFYVMPYVARESLRERLVREKQLPLDEALRITAEVADALAFAHAHGVLHRDIKPENILFEGSQAVLADFGLARAIRVASGKRLTESGLAVGTPEYMSPEQAAGEQELTVRSDVYSLGCVLYEMLAGRPPFTGPTIESVTRQQLVAEPPRVTLLRTAVPRFESAAQFGEAIAPSRATAPSGMVPTDRRGRRRRAMIGGALVLAVAALAVIASVLVLPPARGGSLDPARVLVVAFADESGLTPSQALGRMAQDYIIQSLTDAGFASVVDPITSVAVARNVTAAGSGGGDDVTALANDAQAGTVVTGSYYAAGDSVHVQVRITDANDGSVLQTVGPVGGSVDAPSELVARLGRQVVGTLASLLDRDIGSWEPTVQPATYEAYEAYSEGLEAYVWEEGHAEAARHFERAAAADSTFTRAALWAAQSYAILEAPRPARAESLLAPVIASRGQLSRYERCRLDYVVAMGIRPSLSGSYDAARCMAHAAPGSDDAKREVAVLTFRLNRPREAIVLLRQLDPDRGLMKQFSHYWAWLAGFHHTLGDYEDELEALRLGRQRFPESETYRLLEARALAALGRLDDVAAILEARRSLVAREPLGIYLGSVAVFLRSHGHRDASRPLFDEAIEWFRSRPQDSEGVRAALAHWLYEAERWGDAQHMYTALTEEHPGNTAYLAARGRVAARLGDTATAIMVGEQLRAVELRGRHTLDPARIAALLGDVEQATALLEQAIERTPLWGVHALVHRDSDFDSLRDYPPFQELMRPKG